MSNNTSIYAKFEARVTTLNAEWGALNKMNGVAVEAWNDSLDTLKADIFNSGLTEDEKDELYDLLGLENSQNINGRSVVASQRKSRRSRKSRKTRKTRKARKQRKARKTRNV
jgi:hypothetical protein